MERSKEVKRDAALYVGDVRGLLEYLSGFVGAGRAKGMSGDHCLYAADLMDEWLEQQRKEFC